MNPIFRSCEKWHTEICWNELIRTSFFQTENEAGASLRTPFQDMEELNNVCTACDVPLEIIKRECPVCGGYVFQDADIPMMEVDTLKIYNYWCSNCSRELFSYAFI
jgi:hypothetical protein